MTFAPPPYSEETNSKLPGPHTGVATAIGYAALNGTCHCRSPLFGSTAQTAPSISAASCCMPPTSIRSGEEYVLRKSFLAQATLPSACLNAINALPGPPTGTITASPTAMGLEA